MTDCKLLADSVSPEGYRLTTFEITFPRFILAELNTHRMLSRNSASSRAIPIEKSIAAIEEAMFVPAAFGAHQRGMQADEALTGTDAEYADLTWRGSGEAALDYAASLSKLGVHKAWANRILEPYKYHTALVTATEWSNFFALRTHKDAQPEFREVAGMMKEVYEAAHPWECPASCYHVPLVGLEELGPHPDYHYWNQVAVGRCARVSVEQHDGQRDTTADVGLHNRLLDSRHLSPFEHVARPFNGQEWDLVRSIQRHIERGTVLAPPNFSFSRHAAYLYRQVEFQGNLRGWHSARMDIAFEHDFGAIVEFQGNLHDFGAMPRIPA